MERYRVIQVNKSNAMAAQWAIERTDSDGSKVIVSPIYLKRSEADAEAETLTKAALRRTMG